MTTISRLPAKTKDTIDQQLARAVGLVVLKEDKHFFLAGPDHIPLSSRTFAGIKEAWNAVPNASSSWEGLLPYLKQGWKANLYLQVWHEVHDEPYEWTAMWCSIHEQRVAFQQYGTDLIGECYGIGNTIPMAIVVATLDLYKRQRLQLCAEGWSDIILV